MLRVFAEREAMSYTRKIEKDRVQAHIRTNREKIEGFIFKMPQNRLLDMLNQGSDQFIPVTRARVFCLETGKLLFETEFLAVNKNNIIVIAESAAG
jgi:hypothetical protein